MIVVVAAAALRNRAWCRSSIDFHHSRAGVEAEVVVVIQAELLEVAVELGAAIDFLSHMVLFVWHQADEQ